MRETTKYSDIQPLTVKDKVLAEKLNTSVGTARKISEKANAVVKIGKTRLNNLRKIQEWLDEHSEGDSV